MPVQAPQWTEFLSCPICYNEFESTLRRPISLGCGHTICKSCLSKLQRKQCPFDQTTITPDFNQLPENYALLQLVGGVIPEEKSLFVPLVEKADLKSYFIAKKCIEELALYLQTSSFGTSNVNAQNNPLSRPMQRKIVTLINCQLVEEEGRTRGMRAARSLGERSVTELILQHQNPQQLSANLWAAVRARGCQFLGPAMQEEVLKLVLLALEDGSALSRKVLVMFVVQRLAPHFPQASKTSIGHVVQLLYRASCFKVSKREGDSSLMQLKEEFRTYDALRREHDAQIVQIATEAGLRIAPEQWSSLLYGDTVHKSHMQSIIDKLQTPQSFAQSVQELVIALQRTGDPGNLSVLRPHLELLASIDPSPDAPSPIWDNLKGAQEAAKVVVKGLVEFVQNYGSRKQQEDRQNLNVKYKTSMCRDLTQCGSCPRGINCTFAHCHEELDSSAKSDVTFSRNESKQKSSFEAQAVKKSSSAGLKHTVDACIPAPFHCSAEIGLHSILPNIIDVPCYQPTSQSTHVLNPETPTFQPLSLSCQSLTELQQRRKAIIAQLQQAKSANGKISCRLSIGQRKPDGEKITCKMIEDINCISLYSPWTSASLFSDAVASSSCPNNNSLTVSSSSSSSFHSDELQTSDLADLKAACNNLFCPSEKDEFIPFDPPFVSKYGPISRSKNLLRGPAPIQVNAVCQVGELTCPTCAVTHPLLSSSFAPTIYTEASPSCTLLGAVIHTAPGLRLSVVDSVVPAITVDCTTYPNIHNPISSVEKVSVSTSKPVHQSPLKNVSGSKIEDDLKYFDHLNRHRYDSRSGSSVPTSIGPWPTQTLEHIPYKPFEPKQENQIPKDFLKQDISNCQLNNGGLAVVKTT